MTFMDSLVNSPGGSGIYGQPGNQDNTGEALNLVNKLKDREMRDFMDKANFMSDLSLRQQNRNRAIENNPDNAGTGPSGLAANLPGALTQRQVPGQPNTVLGQDPNVITPYQKGELGIRQQGLNLESQKIAQSGKLGQEAIDVKTAQEKLNQEKSNQINAQKTADMERKANEAAERIRVTEARLEQTKNNAEEHVKAQKEHMDALDAYHKADMARKEHEFGVTSAQHAETIKQLQKRLEQAGSSRTTTEIDASGNKKTVTTQKGDLITVTGKDGKQYTIPKDKEEEWNREHKPEGDEE